MSTNVYVGNLSFRARDEDLAELFAPFGEVVSARVITDRETHRSRGFGFVEMARHEDALRAIQELDQKEFMERVLKVSLARGPQTNRRPGGRRPPR
jgi:RNA recognition motif-containing protein